MTPEVAYNLIENNKESCFKIYSSAGHSLTSIVQVRPETGIAELREKIDLLAPENKALIVYGGKDANHCNNKDGHTYYIETSGGVKGTTPGTTVAAPIVSGVPFETVLGLLSKKDDTISNLQSQVAAAQLADVKREIELLKNKKDKPNEIMEYVAAAKEIIPMMAALKGGGFSALRPGISGPDTSAPAQKLSFEEMKNMDVTALTGVFNAELQKMQTKMGPIDGIAYLQLVNSRPADVIRMAKFLLANPDKIDLLLTLIPADFK